jgi:cytochrome c peroxidase
LFADAFPDDADPLTLTTSPARSPASSAACSPATRPYDRYTAATRTRSPSPPKRGAALFASRSSSASIATRASTSRTASPTRASRRAAASFHNTGLYNIDGKGAYPPGNTGLHEFTGVAADMGRFRVPTLRNIAVTGPYMHDGSVATLSEVLDHYAAGGRTIADGPHAGVGRDNPFKSGFIRGFELTSGAGRRARLPREPDRRAILDRPRARGSVVRSAATRPPGTSYSSSHAHAVSSSWP